MVTNKTSLYIPYTSHNSAMCFVIEHRADKHNKLIDFTADFLEKECADGSDPGLCIAEYENIKDHQALMDFIAKKQKTLLVYPVLEEGTGMQTWHTCVKAQLKKY